jgi:hypothetical protein
VCFFVGYFGICLNCNTGKSMAKQQKGWVYVGAKSSKSTVPESLKCEVTEKANLLVETILKPAYIKPPPKNADWNYLIDIYTKWYRGKFYFCGKYCSPGPNAIAPGFEMNFARLEYVGGQRFNLAYLRHTGQWGEIYEGQTLEECLALIKNDPAFQP